MYAIMTHLIYNQTQLQQEERDRILHVAVNKWCSEEYNVMVNSEVLIGTTEYLT